MEKDNGLLDKGMSDEEYWNKLHVDLSKLWRDNAFKLPNRVGKHGTRIIACDPKVRKGTGICHWNGDCDNCKFAKEYAEETKAKEAGLNLPVYFNTKEDDQVGEFHINLEENRGTLKILDPEVQKKIDELIRNCGKLTL